MASPKDVTVTVILESDNPTDFRIDSTDLPKDSNGDLVFTNNGHNGFRIRFVLTDNTGKSYLFPTNSKKHEAVWSELGSKVCPQPPGKSEVFHPIGVDTQRTTLTVHNPNPKPAQGPFGYTLRVTNDGGTSYLPLDPGGLNQNGGRGFALPQFRTSTVIGVAAVVIVVVALLSFTNLGR